VDVSVPRDLARHLPLSNRPRHDESDVDDDWAARLATLVSAGATGAAVDRARARRRVRIGDLGAALAEAWETQPGLPVDATTSGAVALARALAAPLPIRAVVKGRTLRATDAGWEFGSGPEIAGTARELVLFLYGRGPVPSA
jgi:hypothetical protein